MSNTKVFNARKFIVLFNGDCVLVKKPPLHAAMFRSFRHCLVFCMQFLRLCCDGTAEQTTLTISSHQHNRNEVRSSTWRILSLRTNRVVENTPLLLPGRTESASGRRKPYHVQTSIVNMSKGKVFSVHTIKTFGSRVIAPFIPNLKTRRSRVVRWSRPGCLYPLKKSLRYLWIRSQSGSGLFGKQEHILPLSEIERRFLGRQACLSIKSVRDIFLFPWHYKTHSGRCTARNIQAKNTDIVLKIMDF